MCLDNSKPSLNWLVAPSENMTTSETGGQLNQDVAEDIRSIVAIL